MNPETEEIIKRQMEKLPIEVTSLFTGPDLENKISNIGKKYGLSPEQLQVLQTETFLVMLGLVHPDEYSNELKNSLGNLDDGQRGSMIADINREVFSGIADKLKEAYEKTEEATENEIKETRGRINEAVDDEMPEEAAERERIVQKLDERFDKLPDKIKDAIVEYDYYNVLYNIAQDHQLNVLQTGNLEELTTNVITGTLLPEKYTENIEKSLKLSEEETEKLIKDINEKILRKIRDRVIGKDDIKISTFVPPIKLDENLMQKNDKQVLRNAGIELAEKPELLAVKETLPLPNQSELETPNIEKVEETSKEDVRQRLETVHPLLVDKMSKPVKVSPAKTEYSLGNLSKTADLAPDNLKRETPAIDPYRELPQ